MATLVEITRALNYLRAWPTPKTEIELDDVQGIIDWLETVCIPQLKRSYNNEMLIHARTIR